MDGNPLRLWPLLRITWLACSLATTPAVAQLAGQSQARTPAAETASSRANAFIARFRAANTTGDRRLTLVQAEAGNLPAIAHHFDEIDSQHRGYVTLQDIVAFRRQMRTARSDGHP